MKLSKKITFRSKQLEDCCSVRSIGGFTNQHHWQSICTNLLPESTSRLHVATFTPEAKAKNMYILLCKDMLLLYQSPVCKGALNLKTGKWGQVFLCVFQEK